MKRKPISPEKKYLERHRKAVEAAAGSLIERYQTTLGRIRELRDIVKEIDSEMEYFRSKEPVLLDGLRAQMLQQFVEDPDRRWSTTDYGILQDKSRLMRGESSVNLSSLMGVVLKAEEMEMERLKGSGEG